MHPFVLRTPDPLQIMSHAERLDHQARGSNIGLVFQGFTAISLGVVTTKMLFDMLHQASPKKHYAALSRQDRHP